MSWSKKRRSPGWASSNVATRTAGSAIASVSAARAARGSSPARQPHEGAVANPAAEPDEAGGLEARGVEQDARSEREERGRAVGLLSETTPVTVSVASPMVSVSPGVSPSRPRTASSTTAPPPASSSSSGRAGTRLESPVEGIAALDRLQLDEERAALCRVPGHRHELAHPRHRGAAARQVPDRRLRRGVERAGGAQLDVAAEERPRLTRRASDRARRPRSARPTRAPTPSAMHARKPAKCRQAPRVSRQARPATRRQGSAGAVGASAEPAGFTPRRGLPRPARRGARRSARRGRRAQGRGSPG